MSARYPDGYCYLCRRGAAMPGERCRYCGTEQPHEHDPQNLHRDLLATKTLPERYVSRKVCLGLMRAQLIEWRADPAGHLTVPTMDGCRLLVRDVPPDLRELQTSPYLRKCKRLRTDGPTPCLCCPGECIGQYPGHSHNDAHMVMMAAKHVPLEFPDHPPYLSVNEEAGKLVVRMRGQPSHPPVIKWKRCTPTPPRWWFWVPVAIGPAIMLLVGLYAQTRGWW